MDTAQVIDVAREALWVTVIVAAPMLVFALVVGVIIGVLQAATSVQEMTLAFIPKLAALAVSLAFFGGWMIGTLVDFARRIFERIPGLFI